ncbi:CBS domain-containing protein [Agaribacterium sp. ZY112]|uniref:CBS domain-containing protein n=1 Tax=Agaribacterium sp. ZY112 TaxID=3233574 RepID=UPI003526833C
MLVADIMTKSVTTVTGDTSLEKLKDIFLQVSFRHLLVEENNKLVGVLSDRDVLHHTSPFLGTEHERDLDKHQMQLKCCEFMARDVISVDEETLIDSASILLIENNISCLPVVDEFNEIRGIVSWKDILQYHVYGVDKTLE